MMIHPVMKATVFNQTMRYKRSRRQTGGCILNHFSKKNFLHSHFASLMATSMTLEKIITQGKLHIFIGTWNMNGRKPLIDINRFILPAGFQNMVDIIVIGTQETCISNINKWETTIKNAVGPSYILKTRKQLGELHLILFLRRELTWFSSTCQSQTVLLRRHTIFRTKGAVCLSIIILGTSFLFITMHLAAHQNNVKKRVKEIEKIIRNLDVPKSLPIKQRHKDRIDNFDSVFIFGDLNFRLNNSREEVMKWIDNAHFSIESPVTLKNDQLNGLLRNKVILKDFHEAPITFPPTYKYNSGSQILDSNHKRRIPSYTDRILYKGNKDKLQNQENKIKLLPQYGEIECLVYDSARNICSSDHKPVYGIYSVTVRAGKRTLQPHPVRLSSTTNHMRVNKKHYLKLF